jgi:hypothetical protein
MGNSESGANDLLPFSYPSQLEIGVGRGQHMPCSLNLLKATTF